MSKTSIITGNSDIQMKRLEKEVNELTMKLFAVKEKYERAGKERSGIIEIGDLEVAIKLKENEIEKIRLEILASNRTACLKEAEELATEKKKLLLRVKEIDDRGHELQKVFEANIPVHREQVSSSQFIKMERTLNEPTIAGFDLNGKPVTQEMNSRREETIVDAIPAKVKRMEAAGWVLCPNQKIEPEPIDASNSILIMEVGTPAVFESFFPIEELVHI